MAEVEIPTKADAIALLARRLRQRYGNQLRQLFLLKEDPYEPLGEDVGIDVVAVFADDTYDFFETVEEVVRIGNQVDAEMDYQFASTVHTASHSEFESGRKMSARAAKEDGISL